MLQFLRDEEAEPPTTVVVAKVPESLLEKEEKCRKKMVSDPPYSQSGWSNKGIRGIYWPAKGQVASIRPINQLFYHRVSAAAGLHCGRHWDGQLCWDDTPAGSTATQNCPDTTESAGDKRNIESSSNLCIFQKNKECPCMLCNHYSCRSSA